jgi:UPF0716 protein FxsA
VLALLVLLFVVVPFVELYVIIQVAHVIGGLQAILLLLAVSIVGGWLMKREGLAVWRQARARVDAGSVPGRELVDGVLVLFAGALLLTPGFVTDAVGILLLLPPVRAAIRGGAVRALERRAGIIDVRRRSR